jgi:cytolysin-activating lysine-acyltransferase
MQNLETPVTTKSNGERPKQPAPTAAPDQPAAPTAGAARSQPTVSHMLGEMVWVLTQSGTHKHFSLTDLEWMIMPALLANQFRVFHSPKSPVGFALWASLSPEVEAKLCAQVDSGAGARLRPDEWRSGDRLWLIDLVGVDGQDREKFTKAALTDLVKTAFAGRKFKFHAANPLTGKREVKEIGG